MLNPDSDFVSNIIDFNNYNNLSVYSDKFDSKIFIPFITFEHYNKTYLDTTFNLNHD